MHPETWSRLLSRRSEAAYAEKGLWKGKTTDEYAAERVAKSPDRVAVVDGVHRKTYAQIMSEARRVAAGLRDMGLKKGDVISFQLPNWWESIVVNLAAALGGWVVNPIVPIYRDVEVSYILGDCNARVFFIPEQFRSINYLEMAQRLAGTDALRDVQIVTVRGGDAAAGGVARFETLGSEGSPWQGDGYTADDLKLILYTSGTTGRAKGVLHSSNTLMAELQAITDFWSITEDDVVIMPSPVTHITGYCYALEYGFFRGVKVVLMERWDARQAVDIIMREGATLTVGATPFLAELADVVSATGVSIPHFRLFASGGAPVPPDLVLRASRAMPGCLVCRVYGSSEAPTVTLGINDPADQHRAAHTDGRVYNNEVKVLDPVTGKTLPPGSTGELAVKGPEVMLGYLREEDTATAFDEDGYFLTGDLGYVGDDGFVTISGRKKDIIIRGGENLSPREIEDVLHEHPDVFEAAVVAMPHPRLGETPCAYIVLRPGATMSFDDMVKYLNEKKLARQKLPERLVVIDEMPKNASGKMLKHVLKSRAAELPPLESA